MNYIYLGFRIYSCNCGGGGLPMPTQPIIVTNSGSSENLGGGNDTPAPQPVDPWTNSAIDFPVGVKK